MSQEQQPIRSRRELRRARDARQALQEASGEVQASAGVPTGGDARAQDQPRIIGASSQAAPRVPSMPPVPAKPVPAKPPVPSLSDDLVADQNRVRRVADAPVDAASSQAQAERSSLVRARDRAALRAIKELADKEGQLAGNGPPTRRQLRLQQLREEVAPATARVPIVDVGPDGNAAAAAPTQSPALPKQPSGLGSPQAPPGMTVEQALAARELIAAQAQNQLAKMEHIASQDPEAVDPEILAEQIAVAERAAVLNKRAQAKQKLAEQSTRPQSGKSSPTTANNLAMVTPLEFVKVPGVDRPVMKPPSTTFVPVATNAEPKLAPAKTGKTRPGKGGTKRVLSGRAGVLARAEAAAKAAAQPRALSAVQVPSDSGAADPSIPLETGDDFAELPRVSASAAYGLEPLDAATAGLGRAQRHRLVQLGILAAGIVALVAGVAMIISGLAR